MGIGQWSTTPYTSFMPDLREDIAATQAWWESLERSVPETIAGLWFGLFSAAQQDGRAVTTLFVVGTAAFDADDEAADWAASEYVWQPEGRYVELPELAALPSSPYEAPLAHVANVLTAVRPWQHLSGVGAAVGYDDGDFLVLHRG